MSKWRGLRELVAPQPALRDREVLEPREAAAVRGHRRVIEVQLAQALTEGGVHRPPLRSLGAADAPVARLAEEHLWGREKAEAPILGSVYWCF